MHEPERFHAADNESLHDDADLIVAARERLAAEAMTTEDFNDLKTATGLSTSAAGLLADRDLSEPLPILDCVVFDEVHTLSLIHI